MKSHKFLSAAATAAALTILPHLAHAFGKAPPKAMGVDRVTRYFDIVSQGAIIPNDPRRVDKAAWGLSFLTRTEFPQSLIPATGVHPSLPQSLFRVNVRRANLLLGGKDFVQSSRLFYGKQNFRPEEQAHSRPYYYLSDWGHLFHPPILTLDLPLEEYFAEFTPGFEAAKQTSAFFDADFQKRIDERTGTELSLGNRVQLLANGDAFPAKLALVNDAKRTLFISIMAWFEDGTGKKLLQATLDAKKRGVDVRVMTERFYRETLTKFLVDRLIQAGIPVLVVGDSMKGKTMGAVNHQKVWIRDGEEAIIGGQNILDYENESTGFNHMNRDQDLHILTGSPLVTDAQEQFLTDWLRYPNPPSSPNSHHDAERSLYETRAVKFAQETRGLRGKGLYDAWMKDPETRMNGVCRVALQTTLAGHQPIGPMLEAYLAKAKTQVILTTPDVPFNPHSEDNAPYVNSNAARIMRLLESRGGPQDPHHPKIHVISNGLGGGAGEVSIWFKQRVEEAKRAGGGLKQRVAQQMLDIVSRRASLANREEMKRLQKANPNLRAYAYVNYIHAKLFLFDRIASFVGSWNLDRNSADLNHEAGVLCLDQSLRDQLEHQLAKDLVNSIPIVSANGE